jgi:hypothetical protein
MSTFDDFMIDRAVSEAQERLQLKDRIHELVSENASLGVSALKITKVAEELHAALKEYDDAFTEFDADSKASRNRMRLAVVKARDALSLTTDQVQL